MWDFCFQPRWSNRDQFTLFYETRKKEREKGRKKERKEGREYIKQWFSKHRSHKTEDNHAWETRSKLSQCTAYDSSLAVALDGELRQSLQTPWVEEMELRVQGTKAARVRNTEHQRGQNAQWEDLRNLHRTLRARINHTSCEETTWSGGKNHLKGLEEKRPSAHTGLGTVPTATSHTKKAHNSWHMGWSAQEGLTSAVRND